MANKKILSIFMLLAMFTTMSFSTFAGDAANGEKLYKAWCAGCHKPDKDATGPKLQGSFAKWEEQGYTEEFYQWVQNSSKLIEAGNPYAKQLFADWGSMMTPNPINKEEIDDIVAYVDSYAPKQKSGGVAVDPSGVPVQDDSNIGQWMLLVILLLIIIVVSATGIRRTVENAMRVQDGEGEVEDISYSKAFGIWAWKNKALVSIVVLLLVVGGTADIYGKLLDIGVHPGYQPEQPIAFSHKVHAGNHEIECQYCHSGAEKSKHAGIPSTNVCMNCHKSVTEGTNTGTEEIGKIYEAIGFDPEDKGGRYIEDYEEQPIAWNKVHNLPDHVYFSHQQHVKVGKLKCQNCHGPVETFTVGKIASIEEINNQDIPGMIKVDPAKETLTMGWCIDCHNQASIDLNSSEYYQEMHDRLVKKDPDLMRKHLEDDKISVREMGGWECSKCHY